MIDDIKILVEALGNLENGAIYLLVGFISYKLVTFAGITGALVLIGRLFITKLHDWAVTKKTVIQVQEVKLDDMLISSASNSGTIHRAFDAVRRHVNTNSNTYIHAKGCQFIEEAINEKIERERT